MTEIKTEFTVERVDSGGISEEMKLGKAAADLLHEHYPGHLWAVSVDTHGGVMYIKNLGISQLFGYVLHLTTVYADPRLKCVMRVGGEFLERANMLKKWDGQVAKRVEGLPDKYQPSNGLIQ